MTIPSRIIQTLRASFVAAAIALLLLTSIATVRGQAVKSTDAGWQPLFDGKTLTNWAPTKFFGQGAVKVDNGQIVLEAGKDLTGITWTGPTLPTTDYEITLQAMRVAGTDFFAGVTFPVGDSFCSFILGGWGGQVIGLSSLNGMDASENETSQSAEFESQRWYTVRIRVTPAKIETWLDEKQIINQNIKGAKVHIRPEMDPSTPLGVASWRTKAALRDLRLRRL